MFDLFKRKKGQRGPAEGDPTMFAEFLEYFGEAPVLEDGAADPYDAFIDGLGGRSFGNGVFKSFGRSDLSKWYDIVDCPLFSRLKGRFKVFGYDWRGRVFAVNQSDDDCGNVILLNPGDLKFLYIGCPLLEFLNSEIPAYADACLDSEIYADWLASHPPVGPMECAGYRIPLFLGGEDSLENMEVSDMEVYWDMTDQLWEAVKDLPEGTKIGNISFE